MSSKIQKQNKVKPKTKQNQQLTKQEGISWGSYALIILTALNLEQL